MPHRDEVSCEPIAVAAQPSIAARLRHDDVTRYSDGPGGLAHGRARRAPALASARDARQARQSRAARRCRPRAASTEACLRGAAELRAFSPRRSASTPVSRRRPVARPRPVAAPRGARGCASPRRARSARRSARPTSSSGRYVSPGNDALVVVVRVLVAGAVALLLHQLRDGVAELHRHGQAAVLLDERLARAARRSSRVRLGRARQVERRLRHRVEALGHAHAPERRVGARHDDERARVGVADVLAREDEHAPQDEERVLARLEHAHHPVDRGVRVGAAHRLDERADDVVVLLAGLVVEERRLLLGRGERLAS